MSLESQFREALPVHEEHRRSDTDLRTHILRIDGLVGHCLELTLADLERLPQHDLADDFTCLEGWTVPNVKWRGVLLETLRSLAKFRPEARYVQASAGEFSISLPLDRAEQVLLALRLNDQAVPAEHGGPVRLIVPGGQCFTSIKWLDHLELRSEPGTNTAERIARARLPVKSSTV
jgi:DMSO/TMAO reductase YedYZ molybdopterin-dependent catalytic subunit